jgi:hypothetical protein
MSERLPAFREFREEMKTRQLRGRVAPASAVEAR